MRPFARRGGLFWRVYVFGLLFLAGGLLVVLVSLALAQSRRPEAALDPDDLQRLAALIDNPDAMQRSLDALAKTGVRATAFKWDGTRIASTAASPTGPLADGQRAQLSAGNAVPVVHYAQPLLRGGEHVGYLIVAGGDAQAILATATISFTHLAVVLLGVLGLMALVSLPVARRVAAPIEHLTRTVRAFGEGELSARSGLRRRDEVGQLAAAFDEMAERTNGLLRSERELLANISHELRTPLSRLTLALEMAELDPAALDLAKVNAMSKDLAELQQLVEDVLITARLEARARDTRGLPPLNEAQVNPEPILREAVERFRGAHPKRVLDVSLSPSLPDVQADAALLRRVLDNVLDNAQKYSEPSEPVKLLASNDEGALRVEVRDRGIGIAQADMQRIFTPFFRTDRSRARGTGGVGLGLALSKRIVEAHGGRLAVESMAGLGTVVRLVLPAASKT